MNFPYIKLIVGGVLLNTPLFPLGIIVWAFAAFDIYAIYVINEARVRDYKRTKALKE